MKAFILAAGSGERLEPITHTRPKAFVPILSKPLIEYQIEYLRKCGIRDITVIVSSKNKEYFEKKLKEKGYNIYVFLNRVLTKDVLRNLSPSLDVFLVTSCPRLPIDDLYDFEKPVLTPGEAKMIILNNFDKYIFPW